MMADAQQGSQQSLSKKYALDIQSYSTGMVVAIVYDTKHDVGMGSLQIPKSAMAIIKPKLLEIIHELNRVAAEEAERDQ